MAIKKKVVKISKNNIKKPGILLPKKGQKFTASKNDGRGNVPKSQKYEGHDLAELAQAKSSIVPVRGDFYRIEVKEAGIKMFGNAPKEIEFETNSVKLINGDKGKFIPWKFVPICTCFSGGVKPVFISKEQIFTGTLSKLGIINDLMFFGKFTCKIVTQKKNAIFHFIFKDIKIELGYTEDTPNKSVYYWALF